MDHFECIVCLWMNECVCTVMSTLGTSMLFLFCCAQRGRISVVFRYWPWASWWEKCRDRKRPGIFIYSSFIPVFGQSESQSDLSLTHIPSIGERSTLDWFLVHYRINTEKKNCDLRLAFDRKNKLLPHRCLQQMSICDFVPHCDIFFIFPIC